MTDHEFPDGVTPEVDQAAGQPMDGSDVTLLREVAAMLRELDPVPADLVERVQFSLALDEMFAEVARITRVPMDALAVRSDPVSGTRTESLTFSAERLTAMVTVTRTADEEVRVDGWVAPAAPMQVHLRMQEGSHEVELDEAGRFVFEGLPEGFAQLSFRSLEDTDSSDAVVVTPLFQL